MSDLQPHGPTTSEVLEQLTRRLIAHGVSRTKAIELVTRFSEEEIERQIDWLPYRAAKAPAPLLIAAIEKNYQAPSLWQAQQHPKN